MLSVLSMILAGLALYFYRRRFRLSRSSGEKRLDLFSVCLLSAVAGWLCAVLFTPFAPTKVVPEVSVLRPLGTNDVKSDTLLVMRGTAGYRTTILVRKVTDDGTSGYEEIWTYASVNIVDRSAADAQSIMIKYVEVGNNDDWRSWWFAMSMVPDKDLRYEFRVNKSEIENFVTSKS